MKTIPMDKHQFVRLLQDKKEKYYRIAYSYVKNEHDALDITGNATYKGLKELHTLKHQEYFDTWMTRIVINAAIDHLRKNSHLVCYEDKIVDLMIVTESDLEPEESMDLFDALDALSERDRSCVILRYFEEYSFFEIAEILREPESTVKSRLYRAINKMYNYMGKGGKKYEY